MFKKIVGLMSLFSVLLCMGGAFAGTQPLYTTAITVHNGSAKDDANEYFDISGHGVYVECDDDTGDINDGHYIFYRSGDYFQYVLCKVEFGGDLFTAPQDAGKQIFCHDPEGDKKKGYEYIDAGNYRALIKFGSKIRENFYAVKNMGQDSVCVVCRDGYERSGNDCVEKKVKCSSGKSAGDTWDVDCKTLGITGGVKCGKRCNHDGSETGYVTQCQSNYRLDGKIWEGKYMRCVKVSGGGSGISDLQRCLNSRTTAEGKACCHLPKAVAEWKNNRCICVADGMEFKIEKGVGKCVAKQTQPGETFKCNAELLALLDGWLVSCKDKPDIVKMINQIKVLCASSGVTAEAFNTLWSALLLLNPGECGTQPDLPPPPHVGDGADRLRVSIRIIRDAHSNLSGMAKGFKKSVWKDEEGKFNTSRLVSDSVAGVVLGTAGGLITSNVVKKNQVENGFEDLKCTIGGQVVADWGDQFRVGIQ